MFAQVYMGEVTTIASCSVQINVIKFAGIQRLNFKVRIVNLSDFGDECLEGACQNLSMVLFG
jgi:hypothetical protein